MTKLGNRLRELRMASGCTGAEFASAIGRSPGYISAMEVRGQIPSLELLVAIARLHKSDPKELLELAKEERLVRANREIDQRHAAALAAWRARRR